MPHAGFANAHSQRRIFGAGSAHVVYGWIGRPESARRPESFVGEARQSMDNSTSTDGTNVET
jgi:hypothetical protein